MYIKLPTFCNQEEEYEKRLIIVKDYLDILSTPHADCDKIHQNELSCRDFNMDMFKIVYQICLIKHGEKLYTEIMNYCSENLFRFDNAKLEEAGNWPTSLAFKVHYSYCLSHIRATKFLLEFHQILKRFVHIINRLTPLVVFHLDRIYVVPTFHTNMRDRLNKAFCSEVCARHMEKLLSFARSHPHAIGHQMMMELDQMIYKVKTEVVTHQQRLGVVTNQQRLRVVTHQQRLGVVTNQQRLRVVTHQQRLGEVTHQQRLRVVTHQQRLREDGFQRLRLDDGETPEPPKLAPDQEENQLKQFDEQCLEFHDLVRNMIENLNH